MFINITSYSAVSLESLAVRTSTICEAKLAENISLTLAKSHFSCSMTTSADSVYRSGAQIEVRWMLKKINVMFEASINSTLKHAARKFVFF